MFCGMCQTVSSRVISKWFVDQDIKRFLSRYNNRPVVHANQLAERVLDVAHDNTNWLKCHNQIDIIILFIRLT